MNQRLVLVSRPTGMPSPDNFRLVRVRSAGALRGSINISSAGTLVFMDRDNIVVMQTSRALVPDGAALPRHDEGVDARLGGPPAGVDLGDASGREGGDH